MPGAKLKQIAGDGLKTPAAPLAALAGYARGTRLSWKDFTQLLAVPPPVGELREAPLSRFGISADEFCAPAGPVEYLGKTQYLNGAQSVVSHMVDDSNEFLPTCLDVMDAYGIKATAFVTTGYRSLMPRLWPRLRQAVADGHEIGSHSRRHPCRTPDTSTSCFRALTWNEIDGSRKDILENTSQSHVWSWAYPCGHCANHKFIQRKIALAGYLVGRAYPAELQGQHLAPDLQTYDPNPYAARYTQVAQKSYTKTVPHKGEVTVSGRTDVSVLNGKFDEVLAGGGIYSFLSHPQMLDYGRDSFYERHLAHIGGRDDVWYVPVGPLYAYRKLSEQTQVQPLKSVPPVARFAVFNRLDEKVYNGSITLRFRTSALPSVVVNGKQLAERAPGLVVRWDGEYFKRAGQDILVTLRPNTIVEFRLPDSGQYY